MTPSEMVICELKEKLEQAQAEIDWLKKCHEQDKITNVNVVKENVAMRSGIKEYQEDVAKLKAQLSEAVKALEFYGYTENWETTKVDKSEKNPIYLYRHGIVRDGETFETHNTGGKLARETLAKLRGEG